MEKKPTLRKYFSTMGLFYHGTGVTRSVEEFIIIAKMIYGDLYGYKKVVYKNCDIPVDIECRRHGIFSIKPRHFFDGRGCPLCTKEKKSKYTDKKLFIKRAREKHREKPYDYSSVDYVSIHDPIKILCREHGYFTTTVDKHLHNYGCPRCGKPHHIDNAIFLSRAMSIHGKKYDYSKTGEIKKGEQKITIICPVHGEFTQIVQNHIGLQRQGCPACGRLTVKKKRIIPYSDFLKRARETHGTKYKYVKESYRKMHGPVTVICPEHGPFSQNAMSHVLGTGCRKCAYKRISKSKITPFAEFVRKAKIIHANKYQYEKSSYIDTRHHITILCPEHGAFSQNGQTHLAGAGCPMCANLKKGAFKRRRTEPPKKPGPHKGKPDKRGSEKDPNMV